MKIKSGVVAGLIAVLIIFVAFDYARGEQGSMTDQQQMDQQRAMMQDPQTVKEVQQALSSQGYNPGPADGEWKSETENALMQFQRAQGIQATGQLDQQTLASLGVEGAAAGGQEGEMPEQQETLPDESGAGGQPGTIPDQQNSQQGGSGY